MRSYATMHRKFDWLRFVLGLVLIPVAGLVILVLFVLLHQVGIGISIFAIPIVAVSVSRMGSSLRLACRSCGGWVARRGKSVPFGMSWLGAAQQLANEADSRLLAHFVANAALPDPSPSPFATLAATHCGCGEAGYISLRIFDRIGPHSCKPRRDLIGFGAELDEKQIAMLAEFGQGRWAATSRHVGLFDPGPVS
jgi:hypothetical protein